MDQFISRVDISQMLMMSANLSTAFNSLQTKSVTLTPITDFQKGHKWKSTNYCGLSVGIPTRDEMLGFQSFRSEIICNSHDLVWR